MPTDRLAIRLYASVALRNHPDNRFCTGFTLSGAEGYFPSIVPPLKIRSPLFVCQSLMSRTRSAINLNIIFSSFYNFILRNTEKKHSKTYDYTQYVSGRDYIFESIDNQAKGYMTGLRTGIQRGDYIILCNSSNTCRYQVEDIDYYSEPPDMWIALLQEVDFE